MTASRPYESNQSSPVNNEASAFLVLGELSFRQSIRRFLGERHLQVLEAGDLDEAADILSMENPWGGLVELNDRATGAFSTIEGLRQLKPSLPVIVLSGQPTVTEAVKVMQLGAASYVAIANGDAAESAFVPDLGAALQRIMETRRALASFDGAGRISALAARRGLAGDSPPMKKLLRDVALVAPTRTTTLILGETGTGKECVAHAIHEASPRRKGPFVPVNCAALAESRLDAELFGHERGAFTGAHCRREGRFKMADGGTLFLDEIGELSRALQIKLLRVLQERQFERVGGGAPLSVDVRIIAATNRDLSRMVAEKAFRSDLFYRLNVMVLHVPPLRERLVDLEPLVADIFERMSLELALPTPPLSRDIMTALARHHWPGNVRELENVLERLLVFSRERPVTVADLPIEVRDDGSCATFAAVDQLSIGRDRATRHDRDAPAIPGATLREIERHAILKTYETCGRSPTRTADILGLSLRTVHYRLREYRGESGRRTHNPFPS